MHKSDPEEPFFDPREVYEAFNNGEDLRSLALNLDAAKAPQRPALSKLEDALQEIIKAERDRIKATTFEEAKTDMVIALRQEVARLVKFRTELQAGIERESVTEIFDTVEKDCISRTELVVKELPATAITNVTREIRENRKLICALLNLADSAAESDEAFEKALEEVRETGVIVRGEKAKQDVSGS